MFMFRSILSCLIVLVGVAEVQGLLSDVLRAALKELEELREQGETEDMVFSSSVGDQARIARLRFVSTIGIFPNVCGSCVHFASFHSLFAGSSLADG